MSEALQMLEDLGLIGRRHRERPQPVSLGTDVGPALTGLLARLDVQRDREADRARRAGALLRARAQDLKHRPRAYLRRLTGAGPGADWDLLRSRRSCDEVARPQGNDGIRGRVEIGTTASGSTAWTFDPAQVAALTSLFDSWWHAAAGR